MNRRSFAMLLSAAIAAAASAASAAAQFRPLAPTADFSAAPASPGSWSYRPHAGGSEAYFMDTSGTIRLFVRCTRASRQVTISRTSAAPAATLTIWTTSAQRTLAARFDAGGMRVSSDLSATDRLLDSIAFSRGRFAVSMPGAPPLVVVPAPEAARVFEDCRT